MKLSTRARYALRMMVAVARMTNGNDLVSLNKVSSETKISRRYLEQLVIGLKNGALLRGKSGKGGGYALARPADSIQVRQIIESAIGPINVVECVLDPDICMKADDCECRMLYHLINERIVTLLDDLVLSDLVKKSHLVEMVTALDAAPVARSSGGSREQC
jgi:Rrf2 family protein